MRSFLPSLPFRMGARADAGNHAPPVAAMQSQPAGTTGAGGSVATNVWGGMRVQGDRSASLQPQVREKIKLICVGYANVRSQLRVASERQKLLAERRMQLEHGEPGPHGRVASLKALERDVNEAQELARYWGHAGGSPIEKAAHALNAEAPRRAFRDLEAAEKALRERRQAIESIEQSIREATAECEALQRLSGRLNAIVVKLIPIARQDEDFWDELKILTGGVL